MSQVVGVSEFTVSDRNVWNPPFPAAQPDGDDDSKGSK